MSFLAPCSGSVTALAATSAEHPPLAQSGLCWLATIGVVVPSPHHMAGLDPSASHAYDSALGARGTEVGCSEGSGFGGGRTNEEERMRDSMEVAVSTGDAGRRRSRARLAHRPVCCGRGMDREHCNGIVVNRVSPCEARSDTGESKE